MALNRELLPLARGYLRYNLGNCVDKHALIIGICGKVYLFTYPQPLLLQLIK